MRRGVRTLALLPIFAILLWPFNASSALPGAIGIVITIGGIAWQGFNVLFVGARSAAGARADEIWITDPPGIALEDFQSGSLDWDSAQWNSGYASAVSIAPAVAPSGNAVTIKAETNWEQTSLAFSSMINMIDLNLVDSYGVLWGKGFAYATWEGIVSKEFRPEDTGKSPPIAAIPLKYAISSLSLPYEKEMDGVRLDIKFHAWKLDNQNTTSKNSSWREDILQTSLSLSGVDLDHLIVEGDLDRDNFDDALHDDLEQVDLRLKEPLEREVVLMVPFSDDIERVSLAFRVEVEGTFQIGKF